MIVTHRTYLYPDLNFHDNVGFYMFMAEPHLLDS
jgi:hypothetical protein